jgi:hypothetical protein
MQSIDVPEFLRMRREEAIGALSDVVTELENRNGKEPTEKESAALTKLVQGLTVSINAEKQLNASNKGAKEMRFVSEVRKTIMKFIPQPFKVTKKVGLGELSR